MVTIASLVALFGYWHWLVTRRGWPLASVPLAVFTGAISVLYLGALAGLLRPTAWTLIAGGVLAAAGALRAIARSPKRPDVPWALIVTGLALGLVVWRLQTARFIGWDVFSHWGLVTREMAATHALSSSGSTVLFKDYPPGSALFHYLVTLGPGFSEPGAYIAHALLIWSTACALTVRGGVWAALTIAVFVYFGIFVFVTTGFQALEVDHLLGLCFGGALGSYYLSDDPDRPWRLVPVAFALPLLKSVGLMLAVFLVIAAVVDTLLVSRHRRWLAIGVLCVAPFVAQASWKIHVRALGARQTFRLDVSPTRVLSAFSPTRATEQERVTIQRFRAALVEAEVGPSFAARDHPFVRPAFTMRQWSQFAGVACALLLLVLARDDRRRFLASALCLGALAVCFSLGLLVMYLFSFGPYEGPRLASFGRYMGIVLLGSWTTLMGWACVGAARPAWRGVPSKILAALIAAGMAVCASEGAVQFMEVGPERVEGLRREVRRFTRPAVLGTPETAKVLILAFGSQGKAGYIARYELAPRVTNRGCFGFGSPRFEGDIWTCPSTVDQMRQMLQDYDFVLLGAVDELFWQEYGALFTERAATRLFAVEKTDGIRLSPRPEIPLTRTLR